MSKIHPLRKWRKANAIRQNDLASRAKMATSYLCEIEKGLKEPSLALAAKLAKITDYQVNITDFVRGNRRSAV